MAASGHEEEPDVASRIALELSLVSLILADGAETVSAAQVGLRLSRVVERQSMANALIAAGVALIEGPVAALDRLGPLESQPAPVAASELPQLLQRGVLRVVGGDAAGGIGDLDAVLRRQDSQQVRIFGAAPHIHLALASWVTAAWERADDALTHALDLANRHQHRFDVALLHSVSAVLDAGTGDVDAAEAHVQQARRFAEVADFPGPTVHISCARAVIAQAAGDHREVVSLLTPLADPRGMVDRLRLYRVWWLPSLVASEIELGDHPSARSHLSLLESTPSLGGWISDAVGWLRARLARATGDVPGALTLYGDVLGATDRPVSVYRIRAQEDFGRLLAEGVDDREPAVDALVAAEVAWARIGARPAVASVRHAIELVEASARTTWLDQLSAREREVTLHVGDGLSNPEIAAAMFLSPRTIEHYLRNTFTKLGMTNRRQLREAVRSLNGGQRSS